MLKEFSTMDKEELIEVATHLKEKLTFFEVTNCGGMTNDAAIGYAMISMEKLGFDEEDIRRVRKAMYYNMDFITEKQAENFYYNNY